MNWFHRWPRPRDWSWRAHRIDGRELALMIGLAGLVVLVTIGGLALMGGGLGR